MSILTNDEGPDEMPFIRAKKKSIFRERNTIFFESITCEPSIYTMDHPDITVSNFMEYSIGLKRVKQDYVLITASVKHLQMPAQWFQRKDI